MKLVKLFFFLTFTIIFTSCATIFSGAKEKITVDSDPQGARVIMYGKHVGTTPAQILVKRKASPLKFEVEKEGFQKKTETIDGEGNPVFIWNILNPLFLFCWIDAATGAMFKYPAYNKVTLTPLINQNQAMNNDLFEKLNKLKQLLDNGILTKEEYETQKKKLLENNSKSTQ
jgi:hypothetical protein